MNYICFRTRFSLCISIVVSPKLRKKEINFTIDGNRSKRNEKYIDWSVKWIILYLILFYFMTFADA